METQRICIAQLNPTVNDFDGNTAKIVDAIRRAKEGGARIVVTPESAILGYPSGEFSQRRETFTRCEKAVDEIRKAAKEHGMNVVTMGGNPNTMVVINGDGEISETWDLEDNGHCICPDFGEDVATVNFYLENSPYVCGGPAKKETELVDDVRGFTTVYVNQVGANDELLFHGGSMVLSSDGDVVARGATFEEDLVFVDIDGDGKPVQKEHIDHEWAPEYDGTTDALDEIAPEVLDALVLGVRDYCHKSGFEKAVVGSSGGIDSAVVLAIAVKALGAENVLAITMPSKFSSEGSVGDSVALAENLGIELRNVSIEGIVDSFRGSIGGVKGIADENLQARARGTILMTISNGENRLVLATGNKAETAAGYCTLYGDTCGAIEVISDCPKMLVYAIAREINKDGEVIPQSVIDKAPSAELSPGQKDSDSLPGYPLLDRIVHERAENRRSIDEILALGLPISESELSRVLGLIDRAEFKRRQSPSGLRVTGGAFLKGGLDIPLVAKK